MKNKLKNSIRNLVKEDCGSATKAGIYYFVCQVLIKGIAFISTPIFTRLLSGEEYGAVSNFTAWQALLLPLVTLDLRVSINRSRYEFPDDNSSFLTSIILTSNIVTMFIWFIFEINQAYFCDLLHMNIMYIRLLYIYIIFQTAFDFQQIQHNIFHKYKLYVLYSIITAVASMFFSVALVFVMQDKLMGRVIGFVIPTVVIGLIIERNIWRKSSCVRWKYIKFAITMSIPLLPSALSATILSSSDRAMITSYCGEIQTAYYSVAYSVSSISGVLWTALNQAWSPWLYDRLNAGEYEKVRKYSNYFALLYTGLVIGIIGVTPEIIYVMGGKNYMHTLSAMPPVILAMVFQFFYAFYFNVEYFYGETYIISLGTIMASIINIVLNIIFIPKFGYIAAAYTTLVGYIALMVFHYLIVRIRLKKASLYDNKYFVFCIGVLILCQIGMSEIYQTSIIRYFIMVMYFFILFILGMNHKEIFISLFKNRRK